MIELDQSQQEAASVEPDERQVVFAGPGAGKSEVVGALAASLVDKGILPEDILIISFSRAAVDVVRRRTSAVVDEGHVVDVSTIDALAARLLADHGDGESEFRGYEETIKAARGLLTEADEPLLADVQHVIVDEVQDVVGVRAEFVLSLLAKGVSSDAGFTLLGDPLQALYDFQLGSGDVTSQAFLDMVTMRWTPDERELTGQHRSRSDDADRVAAARRDLMATSTDRRVQQLRILLADLVPLGELDPDAAADIAEWDGSTALLCDTNARAGLAADRLAAQGVPVTLATSALDPGIPAWVAQVVGDRSGLLSRSDFTAVAETIGLPQQDELWWSLLDLAAGPRGVDLDRLLQRLVDPRQARRIGGRPQPRVVASTVHRAKGLEFDNVVLVDPLDWDRRDSSPQDQASLLYVGMSRARGRLTTTAGVPTRGWYRYERSRLRPWVRRSPRGHGATGMIMEPAHARALGPVDHDLTVHVGAAVRWRRGDDHWTADGDDVPSWVGTVDDEPVARTTIEFGEIVRRLRFNAYGRIPGLVGGRMEGLETIVDPRRTDGRRVWIGARVTGEVQLDWSES
ncbi:MAG TPA: UvrD-helicase domain-containing protein [Microlunatus sp.]